MASQIDYKFISDLEGGCKLKGYVPDAGNSGVTIATGFDLGQRNESDLKKLKLSSDIISKFKPYLGVTKKDAKELLKKTPLSINKEQGKAIDKAVKADHVSSLEKKYNSALGNKKKFSSLPARAQTVIASVSFQYGVNLASAAPKFWKAVTAQNWTETVKILKNFGDEYSTRRKKEAVYLEKVQ